MLITKMLPGKRWNALTIFRLTTSIVFALIAFIFSEVIGDFPPFNRTFLRVIITLFFAFLGYGIFPDIARFVTLNTISGINYFVSRVGMEVMNQMLRLPQNNPFTNATYPGHHAPVGGVSVTQPLILDTSAIIDGRILDIAKTHFLYGTILLPSFVLQELQQVADSADFLKRSRGRRGFEIIEELKKVKGMRIEIWDKEPAAKTVDDKLIKLAKNLHGKIITTDFNLNRVASLSNVVVLNINDLSNAVKTVAVPGEELIVKIVHLGKDARQGVGYLPDGTMIVVEDGADLVGKEIKTEVTRLIQVPAGRMIFVKRNV
ncbi:MAG: PilT protein domain protein [Candidatus Woesebacteria bacterium GW2011_GWB1_38_5b]|nr:MAG: PilT protein domain protein [Candidatus Woesebacteria bacterium GW2011_GWB1_38_5b]